MSLSYAERDPLSAKLCEALGEDLGQVLSINLALEAGSLAEITVRRQLSRDEIQSLTDAYEDAGVRFQKETTYTCIAPKEPEHRV